MGILTVPGYKAGHYRWEGGKEIIGQKHLDMNGMLLAKIHVMWKGRNNNQKNIVNPITRLLASSKTPMLCSSQILLGSSQFLFTLKQIKNKRKNPDYSL